MAVHAADLVPVAPLAIAPIVVISAIAYAHARRKGPVPDDDPMGGKAAAFLEGPQA